MERVIHRSSGTKTISLTKAARPAKYAEKINHRTENSESLSIINSHRNNVVRRK